MRIVMTPKERIQCVLNGKTPDRVPFAPFSELIPRSALEHSWRNQGMGFIVHHSSVGQHSPVRQSVSYEEEKRITTYHTPKGAVTDIFSYQSGASNDGMVQTAFMIRGEEDYEGAIAYINSMEYTAHPYAGIMTEHYLGNEGVTHAWTGEPPYMQAQYYLGLEEWSYHQEDYPQQFGALLESLAAAQHKNLLCHLQGKEAMFNLGNLAGNFSPEKFEEKMVPYFAYYASLFHKAGKKTTIHADASNLLEHKELILPCGVDIVEAFTPPPVGNLSLAAAREAWGENITILINFPETIFYSGYDQTLRFTRELLQSDPCPNKILSLTEMGFVGADHNNLKTIEEGIQAVLDAANAFGTY